MFAAMAIALATVASFLKVMDMPMGGSVTLFSMLFVSLIGYWYGPAVGIMAGVAYGILQFVVGPYVFSIAQVIVDYPLAFGALGLSGFFKDKKYGMITGYAVSVLGRYFFAFLSGYIFFGIYAPEGWNAVLYSLAYNGAYLGAEALLTIIVLSVPPVRKALDKVKVMALS